MSEDKESKTAKTNAPREKRCIICGKPLTGRQLVYCSKACQEENKRRRYHEMSSWRKTNNNRTKDDLYREFVCMDCGKTIYGHISNKRCKDCQAAHNRLAVVQSLERRRLGTNRKLGSTDFCQNCGKPYIVSGPIQKYCKDCAESAIRENTLRAKREREKARAKDPEASARRHELQREDAKHYKNIAVCMYCGKEFARTKEHRFFCSDECKANSHAEAVRRASKKRYEKQKRQRTGMQTCIVCGEKFWRDVQHRTICSDECKAIREQNKKKK